MIQQETFQKCDPMAIIMASFLLLIGLTTLVFAGSTVTYSVATSGDDAYARDTGTGNNYTAASTILGRINNIDYAGFYRWQIGIPEGAKITYALVSMRSWADGVGMLNPPNYLAAFLIDTVTCPDFSNDPSYLPVNLDSVNYSPGTWSAGSWRANLNVSKLVQAFIDNPLYSSSSGYYLGIKIGPARPNYLANNYRTTNQYDFNSTSNFSTKLLVYYNQPPPMPTPVLPLTNSSTYTLQPQFGWNPVTDADSDAVRYNFELDTVATFDSLAKLTAAYSSETAFTPSSNLAVGNWYWRVQSLDSSVNPFSNFVSATSAWCPTQNLTVFVNQPPPAVTLLQPGDGNISNIRTPMFAWNPSTDPDAGDSVTYTLEVGTDSTLTIGLAINTSLLVSTTLTVSSPLTPEEYYWRVISVDNSYAKSTSLTQSFIAFDTTQQNRAINTVSTVIFYLGTSASSTDYTPITFSVTSVNPGATDTVTISVYDGKHPNATTQYYLSRWYSISHTGGIANFGLTLRYTDVDFTDANFGMLSEDQIAVAKYSGGTWVYSDDLSLVHTTLFRGTTQNSVEINGLTSFSDWTLSAPSGLPVELSRFNATIRSEADIENKE